MDAVDEPRMPPSDDPDNDRSNHTPARKDKGKQKMNEEGNVHMLILFLTKMLALE